MDVGSAVMASLAGVGAMAETWADGNARLDGEAFRGNGICRGMRGVRIYGEKIVLSEFRIDVTPDTKAANSSS